MDDKTRLFLRLLPQLITMASELTRVAGNGTISRILDILGALAARGEGAYDDLLQLRKVISAMVADDREPTEEEWRLMQLTSDDLHASIQSYDFSAEETAEEPRELLSTS